ncbi:chemotaxis protein CheB [Candidatus Riflebacteria bacterium]
MEKFRILIVDNMDSPAPGIPELLQSFPHIKNIIHASSPESVEKKIVGIPPDIAFFNIDMSLADILLSLKSFSTSALGIVLFSRGHSTMARRILKSLDLGEFDFLEQPDSLDDSDGIEICKKRLSTIFRNYSSRRLLKKTIARKIPARSFYKSKKSLQPLHPATKTMAGAAVEIGKAPVKGKMPAKIEAVIIGISTGGPLALRQMLPGFPEDFPVPVFIIQHMPKFISHSLAESLAKGVKLSVVEGEHGAPVQNGKIYLAPGGKHMHVVHNAGLSGPFEIALSSGEKVNFCRPSVDVFLKSAKKVYAGNVLVVIMTGMGADGLEGIKVLKEKGAYCLIQDKETSTVFGMPGSILSAGLADEVLPLAELAPRIVTIVKNLWANS